MHFALCVSVKNMDLSIVIPMFNEAENVETTIVGLRKLWLLLTGLMRLLPVNDGSLDNTFEIL